MAFCILRHSSPLSLFVGESDQVEQRTVFREFGSFLYIVFCTFVKTVIRKAMPLRIFNLSADMHCSNDCEICFDKKPTNLPFIPCCHQRNFCEPCIKAWLELGKFYCAKCRADWSVLNIVSLQQQKNDSIV